MKGAFLFLAEGFEEIEALATVDILRRAGIEVETVSIDEEGFVPGAHGITVTADRIWPELLADLRVDDTGPEDLMVFPGGLPGAQHLADHEDLMALARNHFAQGGTVAAICAAPGLILPKLGDVSGRQFTCYDGFEAGPSGAGAIYAKAPAVTDGNLITGRGPGCAVDFALEIVAALRDKSVVKNLAAGMMIEK